MVIIAYLRVSTNKQNIMAQKLSILEYAQKQGLHIDEFIELEMSSRKTQHERKIDTIKQKLQKGDMLIVTELSRLERNTLEAMKLILELAEKDIAIIFVNQPQLSTNQPKAIRDLLLAVYAFIDQSERERISERTKAGLEAAKKSGKKLGRPKGRGISQYDDDIPTIIKFIHQEQALTAIWKFLGKKGTYAGFYQFCKRTPQIQKEIESIRNTQTSLLAQMLSESKKNKIRNGL